jgi:hypothetical protein
MPEDQVGEKTIRHRIRSSTPTTAATLDGMIAFCESVLKELNAESIVVPGHGPVAKHADLVAYVAMLKGVRGKLAALIAQGASLEQVIAAKPTAEWDGRYGDPTRIVNRGYAALSRARAAR